MRRTIKAGRRGRDLPAAGDRLASLRSAGGRRPLRRLTGWPHSCLRSRSARRWRASPTPAARAPPTLAPTMRWRSARCMRATNTRPRCCCSPPRGSAASPRRALCSTLERRSTPRTARARPRSPKRRKPARSRSPRCSLTEAPMSTRGRSTARRLSSTPPRRIVARCCGSCSIAAPIPTFPGDRVCRRLPPPPTTARRTASNCC